jgi:hypothetical protein
MRHIFYVLLVATTSSASAQSESPPYATGDDAAASSLEHDSIAIAELFPEGVPKLLTPGSMASSYRLPAGVQTPGAKKKLPTRIEYTDGPLKWDVATNVVTHSAPVSIIPAIPDPRTVGGAAGGAGELKGHVRYVGKEWEFYGIQSFGAHQGDGAAPTLSDTTTVGSLYKLPAELAGGRIGTSFELNSADQRKTRIEYRQPLGWGEGFVAAEQTFVPAQTDHKPQPTVRAGLNRKF